MKVYPIFRLTMALVAGILFANTYWTEIAYWPIGVLLFLLLALGGLLKVHSYAYRWVFGLLVSFFMFLVGWMLTALAWKNVWVDWPDGWCSYQGIVVEAPQEKARTYQCRVKVASHDVLLYLPKDNLSASVGVGDSLFFDARMESPKNRDGFHEFDYAKFLYYRGISGTAYVPSDAWGSRHVEHVGSLKLNALLFREKVIGKYVEWGIGASQLPVLSALTLGYKGELDREMRDTYSVAGISHVLALSGMHVGIVWFLLERLLRLLMGRRWRVLKWISVTTLLWAFALMVGLEASVVRAVIMCMLMELGRLFGSKTFSLNSLAIAAFFMLLYRPFYLFDIGFQLSFVAVASILFLYPLFYHSVSCKNRVCRWMWGIMSVSLSAQCGTAPLVMYYFSNFSVYFLLANLVAGLLVPMIIYGAFMMIVLAPFSVMQGWVVKMLNNLVEGLNGCAGWISGLPYASVSFSVWEPVEIVLFYMMSVVGAVYWKTRKRKWLIRMLFMIAVSLGVHWILLLAKTIQ